MLQKLGIEVLQGILERVRLGTRESTLDDIDLGTRCCELGLDKIHGIAETTGVVTGEAPNKGDSGFALLSKLVGVLLYAKINLVLALELGDKVMDKVRRLEELDQLGSPSQNKLMLVRDHAQKLVDAMRHLPLRTVDSHLVTGLFSAGEVDLAIVLLLQTIDFGKSGNELTMVEAVDADNLRSVLRILTIALVLEQLDS